MKGIFLLRVGYIDAITNNKKEGTFFNKKFA